MAVWYARGCGASPFTFHSIKAFVSAKNNEKKEGEKGSWNSKKKRRWER